MPIVKFIFATSCAVLPRESSRSIDVSRAFDQGFGFVEALNVGPIWYFVFLSQPNKKKRRTKVRLFRWNANRVRKRL
jgi:hypothetical protein